MSSGPPRRQRFEPELRDELLALAERDFAAADALGDAADADPRLGEPLDPLLDDPARPLVAALADWPDAPDPVRRLVDVTSANVRRLADVVEHGGWPGLTRVGPTGADAAWIIALHGDAADEARPALLEPLRRAVETGEADPRHYATLVDRVAAAVGAPQTYGTIVRIADVGDATFPVPLADEAGLAERRAAVGLPPLPDELPDLAQGPLVPFGDDRLRSPLLAWPLVVEGQASVLAVLESGARTVYSVLAVRPGDRRLGRLRAAARERGVLIRAVETDVIDALAEGSTHGGLLAIVGPRRYAPLEELLAGAPPEPLLVLLDGVEDPYTLGQAIRALYAAGVHALVLGRRSWESAAGTVTRASAGTSERIPTARVDAVESAINACRSAGLRVMGAASGAGTQPLTDTDLRPGTLLVVGGERRGISRALREHCDALVAIPYGRADAPDLGTASAAAVLAFEALRQRGPRSLPHRSRESNSRSIGGQAAGERLEDAPDVELGRGRD